MKDGQTRTSRVSTSVLLLAFAAISGALRVVLGYRAAFSEDVVVFRETDAWYHMRLVDSLVHNFPHRIWFDPYLIHPGGGVTQVGPMLDWLIAGVALLLGAGTPSPRLVDLVGAYTPPVLGALTTVPVYLLGCKLFSRRAGLLAAAIIGLLPGEMLTRSLLGYADQHCLETLLSAATLAALMFALDTALPRRRRGVYAVWSGISLGAYLLTWSSGSFLIAVLCVWGLGYLVLDRLRSADGREVVVVLATSFGIAAFMILPWVETTRGFGQEAMALTAGLVALPLLWALGRLTDSRTAYLSAVLLAGTAGLLTAALLFGPALTSALHELGEMSPSRVQTVAEATPLYKTPDRFPLWRQFTASVYLAVLGLGTVLFDVMRRASARNTLFLTWTATTVAATIGQVRFSYYLAMNVAVLAGGGCDVLLDRMAGTSGPTGTQGTRGWMAMRAPHLPFRASLGAALLALVIVVPSVPYFNEAAETRPMSPEDLDAYAWLRQNTPDPFDDPDSYFRVSQSTDSPPVASYGVMASWDHGYQIIRLARRVPNATGTQAGARDLAAFMLADDEDSANEILTRLDTRYVMTNWLMVDRPPLPSQFGSLPLMAGRDPQDFTELFYRRDSSDHLQPSRRYYPAYYRSMVTRLQSFGGSEVTPVDATWVISFSERLQAGTSIKEIQSEQMFSRYDEAVAFVASAKSDRFRIVGRDPLVSCVPLPALREYAPVYQSLARSPGGSEGAAPALRIFEYRRWKPRLRVS
jgi:dolichyl-diphosphooligosaccharide--protein glycosyltransferase